MTQLHRAVFWNTHNICLFERKTLMEMILTMMSEIKTAAIFYYYVGLVIHQAGIS